MFNDQKFAVMDLRISKYEKVLAEKDYNFKNIHTQLMSSQNNHHVFSNQCLNVMEK